MVGERVGIMVRRRLSRLRSPGAEAGVVPAIARTGVDYSQLYTSKVFRFFVEIWLAGIRYVPEHCLYSRSVSRHPVCKRNGNRVSRLLHFLYAYVGSFTAHDETRSGVSFEARIIGLC